MNTMTGKMLYQALSMGTSVLGGVLAGAAVSKLWKQIGGEEKPPNPKDLSQSNRKVLIAAVLQGVTFAVVKAAVDRAGERSYRALKH